MLHWCASCLQKSVGQDRGKQKSTEKRANKTEHRTSGSVLIQYSYNASVLVYCLMTKTQSCIAVCEVPRLDLSQQTSDPATLVSGW